MTHKELIHAMRYTLLRMCNTNARASEFAFKVRRNYPNLLATTPASRAVYVVTLDRGLKALGWA